MSDRCQICNREIDKLDDPTVESLAGDCLDCLLTAGVPGGEITFDGFIAKIKNQQKRIAELEKKYDYVSTCMLNAEAKVSILAEALKYITKPGNSFSTVIQSDGLLDDQFKANIDVARTALKKCFEKEDTNQQESKE